MKKSPSPLGSLSAVSLESYPSTLSCTDMLRHIPLNFPSGEMRLSMAFHPLMAYCLYSCGSHPLRTALARANTNAQLAELSS